MVFCYTFYAWGLSRPPPCSGTISTILVLGDCRDYYCARGLSRPPSCSGTVQTTIMLGDCSDHSRARDYLDRPRAQGLNRLRLFSRICCFPMLRSGTAPTTLLTFLGDRSPLVHVICTHIQLRGIYLDFATRLIPRLPASSGTTSVRCTCRCISYRLYDD